MVSSEAARMSLIGGMCLTTASAVGTEVPTASWRRARAEGNSLGMIDPRGFLYASTQKQ